METQAALPTEDPMITLCRMVVETEFEDLPAAVVEHAKHSILDTLAVTIGGSGLDGIPEVVELVKDKGGKPESLIPFYGGKVPASEAAFAIGPMPRAMDFGDLHAEAGHVSEYVFATLLAAMGIKGRTSGREFLTAFALGQEVLIRIGIAYKQISKAVAMGDSGGHYIFGAVAAAGKLLGLSQLELENAQGIARTMTQPSNMAMYAPATLMVRMHHGFVCQDAINACLLARKGITGPRQNVLTGKNGYLEMTRWQTEPKAVTRALGETWEMLSTNAKGYVACYFSHTSIGGIIDQMKTHGFEARDIESISIEVSPAGWRAVCEPQDSKWNPKTVPECQFSLPYVVATAAFDKEVFISSYTSQARERQDVRELMSRISAQVDSDLPGWAARVRTTLKDGRQVSGEYIHVKGHPENPFSVQDYIDKFRMCTRYSVLPLDEEIVDGLIGSIQRLEALDDVSRALLEPITPA